MLQGWQTIIYQIDFLMGEAETKETLAIDSNRNEIDFPGPAAKGDLTVEI